VHHDNGDDLIDDSLKSLEQEFSDRFVRIHRSALVAVSRIDRLDKTGSGKLHIALRGDSHDDAKQLIISRRHIADVRRRLKNL
jgi:two-component system response regulator AlgR